MDEIETDYFQHTKRRFYIKTEDARRYPPPYINPWIRLIIYSLMTFLSGCVYWGWNGIQNLLYKSGSFENLCIGDPNLTYVNIGGLDYVDCGARKSSINNLFTIAYSSQLISSIFTGMLLDYIGPKLCFILAQFTNLICWILFSSVPKNPIVLRVCFFFIGFSTESLYMPLTTVSHYFPGNQSFILSIMASVRSISILIPIILSKIYGLNHFGSNDLFKVGIGYGVLCNFSCLFIGFLLIQSKFYVIEDDKKLDSFERESTSLSQNDSFDLNTIQLPNCFDFVSKIKELWRHRQRSEYLMLVTITALFLTSIEFINKSHRDLLSTSTGESASDIFKYIHALSFIPGPFLGYLMDKFGPPTIFVIIQTSCLCYFLCSLTNFYVLKVLACIFFLFSFALCVSDTYCYIRQRFSPLHFGVLNGFCFFVSGLLSLTNIPLYDLGAKKLARLYPYNFRPIVCILVVYLIICITMSITLVFKTRTPQHIEES